MTNNFYYFCLKDISLLLFKHFLIKIIKNTYRDILTINFFNML